jgi:TonB family protein
MLAERFAVTLHGRFTKPHRLFSAGAQRSLALAYEQGPRSKALPFRLGYEKESGSTVQVAVRDAAGPGARRGEHTQAQARPARPAAPSTRAAAPSAPPAEVVIQALEARIAEQIRRAEKRPRKAFVGGRTDETPYAGYVQGVRERLAGAAPPGRPAKPSVVSVAIAPDGSINALDHDRGSGSATYDRRVRAAVQEAAPFPPLPDDIRRRADLLVISFQFPDP